MSERIPWALTYAVGFALAGLCCLAFLNSSQWSLAVVFGLVVLLVAMQMVLCIRVIKRIR